MTKPFLIVFIIALTFSCRVHKPQFEGEPFENTQNFEGTAFTSQSLDSLTKYIESNLETTGMLILKDGKTIYEYAPGCNGAQDYRELVRKIANDPSLLA